MNKYIPQRINDIEEYTPSDAIYPIRLDANECPFSPPDEVMNAFRDSLTKIDFNRYPDPYANALIGEFCRVYGCDRRNVVAGNGSDELISLLVNMLLTDGDVMVVTKPDFSMYAFYAALAGCRVVTSGKADDCSIDFDALADRVKESPTRAVFFSNPCNPTGRAYDRDTVLRFVDSLDCPVVVDEAYMEFCRDGCSVIGDVGERENLIVLKTLSKSFGGAGLRVGFCVAHPDIAAALMKVKSPYNLNAVSQQFGRTLLEYSDIIAERTRQIVMGTRKLYGELSELSAKGGFRALPTDANFVLLEFTDNRAREIYNGLKSQGVIIRCPDERHLRITCGSDRENAVCLQEFVKLLQIDN